QQNLGAMENDFSELARPGRHLPDLVDDHTACHRVHEVEHVVKSRTQGVNVYPGERGDEGLVEFHHQGMSELVALMLDEFDFHHSLFDILKFVKEHHEFSGSIPDVLGLLAKKIIEFLVAGYQRHTDLRFVCGKQRPAPQLIAENGRRLLLIFPVTMRYRGMADLAPAAADLCSPAARGQRDCYSIG